MEKVEGKEEKIKKRREVRDEGEVRKEERETRVGWGGELKEKEGRTLRERERREGAH